MRQLSRLFAVAVMGLGFALAPAHADDAESSAHKPRPNILVLLTDDQRFDALGVLDPNLRTPNMDRLANEGVWFRNTFVTTSLCSPSRAALLTGLPMREHGVVDNNSELSSDLDTFPRAMQRAGYETAMFGKWHMGGEDDSPRPGFDRWVSFPGQGNYYPIGLAGGTSWLNVDGEHVLQKGYITDELTDYTLDWLSSRTLDKPWMAYVSHKAVHAFFEPPPRYETLYADAEIADVVPSVEDLKSEPMWVQNQRNSWHGAEFPYHTKLSLPDFKRDYLETLTAVDDSLGRLMAWLKDSGQLRNTIVIFTSDNGFMFGEHGLIDKRNAFEESIRVPLIIWAPDYIDGGRQVNETVTLLDLAPTILSYAGGQSKNALKGRNLRPLLTHAEHVDWNGELIYEYYWEFNYPHTPSQFALRTDRYKYIQLHGVWDTDALYDLENDPGEKHNLIADPAYEAIRIDLQKRLHAQIERGDGKGEIPFSRKFTQGAVFRSENGSPAAEFPNRWLRQDGAADRMEHVIPDGPDKPGTLKAITDAFDKRQAERAEREATGGQ